MECVVCEREREREVLFRGSTAGQPLVKFLDSQWRILGSESSFILLSTPVPPPPHQSPSVVSFQCLW
jgi:hypothetical protein